MARPRPSLAPARWKLLLIGTAGCSSYDVVHILEKGREPVTDCRVEVDADRAETDPKVFTRIHMHFIVSGRGLDPQESRTRHSAFRRSRTRSTR